MIKVETAYSSEQDRELLKTADLLKIQNKLLAEKPTPNSGMRGSVEFFESGGVDYVARLYRRGGFLGKFVTSTFLRPSFLSSQKAILSLTRPFKELKLLEGLVSDGVSVSKPAAMLVSWQAFNLIYSGMLVTRCIPNAKNLLQQPPESKQRLEQIIRKLASSTDEILSKGVFHTDLHLGNVLFNENEVYVIDFDKAQRFSASTQKEHFKQLTIARWKKSVLKWNPSHSEVYLELFAQGLS